MGLCKEPGLVGGEFDEGLVGLLSVARPEFCCSDSLAVWRRAQGKVVVCHEELRRKPFF